MAINEALLDQLIAGYQKSEDLLGENGLLKQLTKRLIERAMQAEITDHLGYAKNDSSGKHTGNSRNGTSRKKIKGDFGEIDIAVTLDGVKEVLGMWAAETEGAKFWLSILTELRNRGVKDILIACVDGLKGFPEAIEAAFPNTQVQLCIVHLVRHSLNFVSWKQRKEMADDPRRSMALRPSTRRKHNSRLSARSGMRPTPK